MTCQLGREGSKSMEDSRSLWRSGMWGNERRQVISSDCILCRSAFFRTSGRWREEISTTFGTLLTVYMVSERKIKNPIKCLQEREAALSKRSRRSFGQKTLQCLFLSFYFQIARDEQKKSVQQTSKTNWRYLPERPMRSCTREYNNYCYLTRHIRSKWQHQQWRLIQCDWPIGKW